MNCTVQDTYTIKEVMESFEINHDRIACVVNENNRLIGVISQGDIIKALVSGMSIYTLVTQVINPSFLYLHSKDCGRAYPIFKKKKITLLPIIDENYYLQDVITLDDIYNYLEERQ